MELLAPANIFLQPLYQLGTNLQAILPGVIWFILILIIGYFISTFLGFLLKKILYKVNIDKKLRKLDLHDSLGDTSLAKLLGTILKWYVFILFLNEAVYFLNLGILSSFINRLVDWLPSLILSITIIIIGLVFIDFIVHKILEIKNRYVQIIANVIKAILVVVIIFTAIEQLGIKTDLAQNIFIMIVGSVLITFSLALGIGLGLSLKDELKPVIKKLKRKIR